MIYLVAFLNDKFVRVNLINNNSQEIARAKESMILDFGSDVVIKQMSELEFQVWENEQPKTEIKPTDMEIVKQENEMLKETMDFILTELIPSLGI